MKWPRGKCNGQRIVGIYIKLRIDITEWQLLPSFGFGTYHQCNRWLCFWLWIHPEYKD